MTKQSLPLLAWLTIAGLPVTALAQPVGPEFQVNTYTTGYQWIASVASDASGNFVVVWADGSFQQDGQDGSIYGIFGQRYDSSGSPLGGEFQVNTYTTLGQLKPSVASDVGGNFVVVWESALQDGSSTGVFGQRYDRGGNRLGGEFQVNTYTKNQQVEPSVASDATGNFVVVWGGSFSQDGSQDGVFCQRYDSDGNPLGGEFQVNTFTTGFQDRPSVSSDPSGNFVVVWHSLSQDGSHYGVFGQRYDSSGNALGEEFQVNTYTSGRQQNPSIASDASGNFVVVWQDGFALENGQDGSEVGVFGQRYDSSGNALGGEFQVNTYTTGEQRDPFVASDASGNFVVAWSSYEQDGSHYGVFGQRYDNGGNALGGEFQVNTYTTEGQAGPSVASDASGNFVVVWRSFGQDGSSYGIFGQRFLGDVSGGCRSTARNPTSLCRANLP